MPRLPLTDHLNLTWSSLIVAELIKNGLDTFLYFTGQSQCAFDFRPDL